MKTTIPKIFHQIWLQGEMPDKHKYLRDHMLELHPGWEYKFWTARNRPELFNEEEFCKFNKFSFKSDILRYEILLKYGGVYVDTDYLFLKNIEPCMQSEYLFIEEHERTNSQILNNCLIGITPNNYIMKYIVLKIKESMLKFDSMIKEKREMTVGLNLVGPGFFDKCVYDIMGYRDSFHKKYFCPFRPQEFEKRQFESFPEAYAVHLWNTAKGVKCIKIHKTLPCYKRIKGLA